jgi:hypothetical protein
MIEAFFCFSAIEVEFVQGETRMDDKKLLALAKKNAAKALKPPPPARTYDPTLPPETTDEIEEAQRLFKEMKRREF